MKPHWFDACFQAKLPTCELANRAVAKQGSTRAWAGQLPTMLHAWWMKDSSHQNSTQIWLEKSWLVCSKAKETSSFLSVYLKSGGKLKHHCPHPQRCQHEVTPSILMRFTRLLLKRKLGIPDFNSKANLALWVSTKCWNGNTCALGIGEWSGTPVPARPIPKVLVQFKSDLHVGYPTRSGAPWKAALPSSQPLARCVLLNSDLTIPARRLFLLAILILLEMYVE